MYGLYLSIDSVKLFRFLLLPLLIYDNWVRYLSTVITLLIKKNKMLFSRKPANSIYWDFPSPMTHSRIFLPLFKCPETISTRKKIGNEIELRDLSKLYFLHSTAYRHNRKNNCF